MTAAAAMIGCPFIKGAIVVIENDVLAFVSHHISNPAEIAAMLGYYESAGIERQHHSRRVNETALIVVRARVLSCRQSYVR